MLLLVWFATAVLGAAETPQRGGTLRLPFQNEFATLDPVVSTTTDDWAMQRFIFRGLFDYDEQNQLILEQAQDWSRSADRKTYTFHLRPGIRFGNGREVEAEDYVFAFQRVLDPKSASQSQSYLLGIRGAEEFAHGKVATVAGLRTPDPHTLVIELSEPSFVFRFKLALPFTFPVPREVVRKSQRDFREHLVGSGPYLLKSHATGLHWRLVRNPHYHGADGGPDEVDVVIGGDRYLHTMMVERDEADLSELNPQDFLRLRRDDGSRELVQTLPYANVDYIFMNTEMKPFDNVLVRRAVNHALDRERLAKLQPPASAANGIVPASMPWTNPDLHPYEHSVERARALLREAGYADGFETDFWYMREYLGRIPEAIQEELRLVGIKVNLQPVTATALEGKVGTRRQAPMGLWGWVVDFPDASSFFDPTLNGAKIAETQGLNYSFYNSRAVNRLIVQADLATDPAERTQMLHRTEALVMEDAPWAPVVHDERAFLRSRRLHGLKAHPIWMYRLDALWVDP